MMTDTPRTLLQPVLDALPDAIAILDEDGRIAAVNQAWQDGCAQAWGLWGSVGDSYFDSCGEPAAGIRRVLAGHTREHSFEYPVIGPAGRRWYSVQARALPQDGIGGAVVTHQDVTERRESEHVRRESDPTLDALIEASPLAIIVIGTDYRISTWNPAAEKMFGWSAAEVLGELNPIIPDQERDAFLSHQDEMMATQSGVVELEARRKHKDGSLIDVAISRAPLRTVRGELQGSMAIICDISERKRAEEDQRFLAEASDLFASSLDYAETLTQVVEMAVPRLADLCTVHVLNRDGSIRRIAVAHADPAKQHLAGQLQDHYPIPADSTWGVAETLRTGRASIIDWSSDIERDPSEHVRILKDLGVGSVMVVPLIARERTIGAIAFVYGDSGRHYQQADLEVAEELARRAALAIDNAELYRDVREAEQLFRTLVEHVPAVTYSARADDLTALTYISPQFSLSGAYDSDHLMMEPRIWLTTLHPDDLESVRQVMAVCTKTGDPLAVEYRVVSADGETHWRLDQAHLIRDQAGRPLHWQGVVVDISERKRAEDLLRARARQQAAVARLGQRALGNIEAPALIQEAISTVCRTLGVEFGTFARHELDSRSLLIEATSGWRPEGSDRRQVSIDGESLLAYTFRVAEPVISHDVAEETRFKPIVDARAIGVTSTLSVVAPGPDGPLGVLVAGATRGRVFTEDDIHFVQAIGNLLAATIEREHDLEQIRFQARLLDVISQSVIATDADNRIIYWNRPAEDMFGWREEEALGRHILDTAPAEMSRLHGAEVIERLIAGDNWSGDFTLRRRDGSEFPGWITLTPMPNALGETAGVVGVTVDMSERMRAQEERERLLRDLGERVKELTVLHRVAALLEQDGVPPQPLLEELVEILPSAFQYAELAAARVSTGTHSATSSGFLETRWTIRSSFPAGGGLTGTIEVCYIDAGSHDVDELFMPEEHSLVATVADMLGAYLERLDTRAQLRRSEARFRAAAEGGLDALFILEAVRGDDSSTLDYRFVDLNGRGEVLLRRHRDQVVGHTMRELFRPDHFEMFFDIFNQVASSGTPVERELRMPRQDGTVFWLHHQVVPLDDGVAVFGRDITERKALEEQLLHQAFHDSLTGLPNRALFLDRVEHAKSRVRRRHEGIAVLFLDLDNFKLVNDSMGHAAGDQLLIAAAERLTSCIGTGDSAARFGGDEFAILLEDLSDWGTVCDTADSIIDAFHTPFEVLGREIYVTPSIGVAVVTTQGTTASDLLRDADAAMYRAKRNGKARVEVFEPSLTAVVTHRFELENDLRRAIERRELHVHYQPIMDLQSGSPVGVEALVRWKHPVHGTIPPLEFIPIAEETGLIVPIGRWVLRTACRQAVEWNRDLPADRRLMVSVNLSPRQFRDPDLTRQVADALSESGLEPNLLHLEITESLMVEDEELAAHALGELKGLGIYLAVDDFGTGYSSLGSLRRFPVDALKIDRAFISGIENNPAAAVLISGVIDLAHALQLVVVAEGVETATEADRLREMGCDLAQGFYFARPAPAGEMAGLAGSGDAASP